jgi:Resolvase, N terminal domain
MTRTTSTPSKNCLIGNSGLGCETDSIAGVRGLELGNVVLRPLGRTPWFPRTFWYQRVLARTAKGLIGGSERGLAQLRSAADCSGLSAERERVSGILVAKAMVEILFLAFAITAPKRERVIALEPYDKGLLATTLRYPYEVRKAEDYFYDLLVYKVDRLTRSLADFAKLIELFDAHDVSFVSVTQSFNTSSSIGRLTLNVLLSFAQFEREVIGERVRDKIAASTTQSGLNARHANPTKRQG